MSHTSFHRCIYNEYVHESYICPTRYAQLGQIQVSWNLRLSTGASTTTTLSKATAPVSRRVCSIRGSTMSNLVVLGKCSTVYVFCVCMYVFRGTWWNAALLICYTHSSTIWCKIKALPSHCAPEFGSKKQNDTDITVKLQRRISHTRHEDLLSNCAPAFGGRK